MAKAATNEENTETRGPGRPAAQRPQFKRKGALILPTYSIKEMKVGQSYFLKIAGEMTTRDQTDDNGDVRTENGKPLTITTVPVTDLETGEQGSMVAPFIVKKAFDAALEKHGKLEGLAFELIRGRKAGRTNEYSVYEIDA